MIILAWAKGYSDSDFIPMAQAAVKSRTTHPSTVSFGFFTEVNYYEDDGEEFSYYWLKVIGTFNAKNSFNLELKYNYNVIIHIDKETKEKSVYYTNIFE